MFSLLQDVGRYLASIWAVINFGDQPLEKVRQSTNELLSPIGSQTPEGANENHWCLTNAPHLVWILNSNSRSGNDKFPVIFHWKLAVFALHLGNRN